MIPVDLKIYMEKNPKCLHDMVIETRAMETQDILDSGSEAHLAYLLAAGYSADQIKRYLGIPTFNPILNEVV